MMPSLDRLIFIISKDTFFMLAVCKVSEGLGGVEVRECEPKEPGVGEVV